MSIDIHIWVHQVPMEPDPRIDTLLSLVTGLQTMEVRTMSAATDLATEVAEVKTVAGSAVLLLDRIFAIVGSGASADEIAAQVAELTAAKDDLAAAVVRNTPAEVPPVEPPVV